VTQALGPHKRATGDTVAGEQTTTEAQGQEKANVDTGEGGAQGSKRRHGRRYANESERRHRRRGHKSDNTDAGNYSS
jgi:hypothetical protein